MTDRDRTPAETSYCETCERFVDLSTHGCETLTSLATIVSRVRAEARRHGVRLGQAGSMWVACDEETAEVASDHTIVGAWAMLEGVEPAVIYHRLREGGVSPLPTPSRTVADLEGDPTDV